MLNVQSFGDKHPGKRRKNNEDFVAWFEPTEPAEINVSGNLYILADGVGGASEGERASQYAAQKVLHEYYLQSGLEPGERLRKLMTQASEEIYNYTEQSGRFRRMATTMVAAVVRAGKLTVASVGDSRVYLIRDGMSTQLTRDHSIVGEMVANGDMTEKEALSSKIKNRLTRSLGGELEVHVDVHSPIPLKAGDKILLCSDGLTRYALREDIDKLTADGSPREIVERIIQYANRRGGADNVSAILIAYGEVATLEPTIRIPRPPLPQSIEETLDTIPKIRPHKMRVSIPLVWVTLSFGIIGLLALGLFTGLFNINGLLQQTITSKPQVESLTATPTAIIATSNPLFPDVTPTILQVGTPTHTPTEVPTHTLIQTTLPIEQAIVPKMCVSQITQDRGSLYRVLQAFDVDYVATNIYRRCTELDTLEMRCLQNSTIEVHRLVKQNEWIIIPVDKEKCESRDGLWVEDVQPK